MFTSWQVNFADSRKIFYELILRIALKYMKFNISKFNPLKSVSFLSLTSRFVLQNIFLSYFCFLSDLLLTISLFYLLFYWYFPISSPMHLFVIRRRRKFFFYCFKIALGTRLASSFLNALWIWPIDSVTNYSAFKK